MANSAAVISVMGKVDRFKKEFAIVFPDVPEGIMRDLRRAIGDTAKINRNGRGGINIKSLEDPCCKAAITELALHIGELGLGLSVDAQTIPELPA